MFRLALIALLILFLARALWRLVGGVVEGIAGPARGQAAPRAVQMARDPVCGTFVVPERAVAIADRGHQIYFCSPACRDKYRKGAA